MNTTILADSSTADTVTAIGQLGPLGVILIPLVFVLLFSFGFFGTVILLWRGSDRLGIVGLGKELRDDFRKLVKTLDRVAVYLGAESDPGEEQRPPPSRADASRRERQPSTRRGPPTRS